MTKRTLYSELSVKHLFEFRPLWRINSFRYLLLHRDPKAGSVPFCVLFGIWPDNHVLAFQLGFEFPDCWIE